MTHHGCYGHGEIPGEDDVDDPNLRNRIISGTAENPHRLETLMAPAPKGTLRSFHQNNKVVFREECKDCEMGDILRVHELGYIKKLEFAVTKA